MRLNKHERTITLSHPETRLYFAFKFSEDPSRGRAADGSEVAIELSRKLDEVIREAAEAMIGSSDTSARLIGTGKRREQMTLAVIRKDHGGAYYPDAFWRLSWA
jgi:hypothetical protein